MSNTIDRMALEDMIDAIDLPELLEEIAAICCEKADHIQSSYGDKTLAAKWRRDAVKISKVAAKLNN